MGDFIKTDIYGGKEKRASLQKVFFSLLLKSSLLINYSIIKVFEESVNLKKNDLTQDTIKLILERVKEIVTMFSS